MAVAPSDLVDLVLVDAGKNLISTIKEVRAITNLGLKEAKDIAQQTPSVVVAGLARSQGETALAQLEKAGATAELRASSGETIATTGASGSLQILVDHGVLTENEQLDAKTALEGRPPEEFRAMTRMLTELYDLYKQGILSESEFNTKKWEVLARK
ncbi:MAG TPA: ribosomal protein L7/L12 [Actinomycetota bacterium]|nr:ribosomal protein L7/L12 [Actinomycetota bacterium]